MIGSVTFDASGKLYELRFGNAALCRIEEKTGKGIGEVLDMASAPSVQNQTLRLLMWAGMGAKVSQDEVSDIIDAIGRDKAERLVAEALKLAFPAPSAEGNGAAAA